MHPILEAPTARLLVQLHINPAFGPKSSSPEHHQEGREQNGAFQKTIHPVFAHTVLAEVRAKRSINSYRSALNPDSLLQDAQEKNTQGKKKINLTLSR